VRNVTAYQFHYSIQGNPELPVVLFLHGFLGSCRDFDKVVCHLSDEFCCLTVDLPGHGGTVVGGPDEHYTMASTAGALVDWLDHLNISSCCLVGYSMGGRLALYLALEFAKRFPKVVLESASPGLKTEQEQQERLRHDRALADRLEADFPTFLTHWYSQPLFRSLQTHPAFDQVVNQRSQNNPCNLAKSLRYLSTGLQPSLWGRLAQHTNPLLLLVGEHDRKFLGINQDMVSSCPAARLEVIPECGHAVHLECPKAFVASIRNFLQ